MLLLVMLMLVMSSPAAVAVVENEVAGVVVKTVGSVGVLVRVCSAAAVVMELLLLMVDIARLCPPASPASVLAPVLYREHQHWGEGTPAERDPARNPPASGCEKPTQRPAQLFYRCPLADVCTCPLRACQCSPCWML